MTCDHKPEELRVRIINMSDIDEDDIKEGMTVSTLVENVINKALEGLDVESHEVLDTGAMIIWHRVKPN